jgi:hypothetical protein
MLIMDQQIKKLWVEELRSGKYKQGKERLKIEEENGEVYHCCLGVLCEIYQANAENKMSLTTITMKNGTIYHMFADSSSYLPKLVCDWAGLKNDLSPLVFNEKSNDREALAHLNDWGYSFQEIAAMIEKSL